MQAFTRIIRSIHPMLFRLISSFFELRTINRLVDLQLHELIKGIMKERDEDR